MVGKDLQFAGDVTSPVGRRMPLATLPCVFAIVTAALSLWGTASAESLGLTRTYPDFYLDATQYTYTYSAGVGTLDITGHIQQYTEAVPGFTTNIVTNPTAADPAPNHGFTLQATLAPGSCPGPGCVTSGTFRLFGDVRSPDSPYGVVYDGYTEGDTGRFLLGGDLSQFGWAASSGGPGSGVLEFVFLNAAGVVPAALGLSGSLGGMILTVSNSTLGDFQNQVLNQSWSGSGYADVFVPLPAAVWLLGSGAMAVFAVGRRRRPRSTTANQG